MKKTAIIPCIGLAAAFLLPYFWGKLPVQPAQAAAESAEASLFISEEHTPSQSVASHTLSVLTDAGTVKMDMQEYLLGVTAAEMPASFEPEALKAQAVAARTYAMYCISTHRHGDGQVCTDYSCCQSWKSDDALRELWGNSYAVNRQKIADAVAATDGQYLEYEGEPVFAAFHSSSASATEDCGSVWGDLPYLVSVSSPETAEDVPDYVSYVRCTPLDFRDTVLYACPSADFTGDEAGWVGKLNLDNSGRVASVVLGGEVVDGVSLRSLFKLRSTAFELTYTDGEFVFTVTGYGHGVGMSQYGANVMAAAGADYTEILAHYYRGAALVA